MSEPIAPTERDITFDGPGMKARRLALGLTRLQLAAAVRCTEQSIYWWEHTGKAPSGNYLPLLAAALGCQIGDLYRVRDEAVP